MRRKELHIKQAELAETLEISNNHMSSIENGRQKPSLDTFIRLCDCLNNPVPVSLLSGDRKPQIRFLGNHHSGSGNLYHKSFRM